MSNKVYLIECNNEGYITYKIGKTSRDTFKRIKELNTASSGELAVLYEYHTKNASLLEKTLHRAFSLFHIKGEWYSSDLDITKFQEYCQIYDKAISNSAFLNNKNK